MYQSKALFKVLLLQGNILLGIIFKGTGTRDLIWLKVVSLDRFWLVGPLEMDDL